MTGENPVKTILVLSANPKGTKPLRLDEEIREIEQGLQRSKKRDSFEFKSGQAVRDLDIHRSILDYEPQIIHFSGHGAGEPGLIFEDNIGQQKLVDAQALAGLFELFADKVECVVLNACYSKIQAVAIAQHINYVIGMSKEIGDAAAIKFAVGFYDALGAGKDFEFAYKLGCRVIRMAGIPEDLTPKLFTKSDFSGENIDLTSVATSPPQDTREVTVISPSPTATSPTTIVEYRQKVEEFASDAVISDIEFYILNDLQQKLRLTDEQAREVREEVLEPYKIYKQQFYKKVAEEYPLTEKAQAELNKFQNYYKIKDEYVNLLNQEAEKQEAEKNKQQQDKILQAQRQQQEAEYPRQQARQKQQSLPIIQTQPFDFETATLTVKSSGIFGIRKSYEITRSRKQAESFQEDLGNSVFLEMVKIPGGSFLMGSPENELQSYDYERPQHKVTIKPFFMGKFLVTQKQYHAIMGQNPSSFKGEKKPVECVSWNNAVEFCDIISHRTGKTYRLPSEAEWEYACRAGTTTPFHFGETITTDLVNYDGNYVYGSAPKGQDRKETTDVGSFPANALGLYDMHGNLREWCQDSWHDNYKGATKNGTSWESDNDNYFQVLRGGSWDYNPRYCRCAYRFRRERVVRYDYIGFRVVVASPSTS